MNVSAFEARARFLQSLGGLPVAASPPHARALQTWFAEVSPRADAGPALSLSVSADLGRVTIWAQDGGAAHATEMLLSAASPAERARFERALDELDRPAGAYLELSEGLDGGWFVPADLEIADALALVDASPARAAFEAWADELDLVCVRLRRSIGTGAPFTEVVVTADEDEPLAEGEALLARLGAPALAPDLRALLENRVGGALVRFTDGGDARPALLVEAPGPRLLVELADLAGIDEAGTERLAELEGALGVEAPTFAACFAGRGPLAVELHFDRVVPAREV